MTEEPSLFCQVIITHFLITISVKLTPIPSEIETDSNQNFNYLLKFVYYMHIIKKLLIK